MNSSKRLIVNADGFGFGAGATEGIIHAIREGHFISSVSVNANFPEVERLQDIIKQFAHITIGVHLNVLVGRPCLPVEAVRSLVGPDGQFQNGKFMILLQQGRILQDELEAEFDAQIGVVKRLAGERVTHIDSQENTHLNYLGLFLKVARKWKIQRIRTNASMICLESTYPRLSRVRVYAFKPHVWTVHLYRRYQMHKARSVGMRMADRLVTVGYAGLGNKGKAENWRRLLRNLPSGTSEIYCHPAYPDETLWKWSVYYEERAQELAILRDKELCAVAREAGVEIVSFDAI